MSRRKRMLDYLDRDIRDHIARETQDNVDRGMPPDEARYAALRKFGNVARIKEDTHEVWSSFWLDQLLQDIRFGARMLLQKPGFTLATTVLLALGLGGATTLFGPLHSLVLAPLPFPDSDRLVKVGISVADESEGTFPNRRSLDPIFSAVAAYFTTDTTVSGDGPPAKIDVTAVTPEFFATIGVRPRIGGDFSGSAADASLAVVSDKFWRTRLQSAKDPIGRSILLDGERFAVVGVMPPAFDFPSGTQVWEPNGTKTHYCCAVIVGRLQNNLSLDQAAVRLDTIATNTGAKGTESSGGPPLESLHNYLLGDRRPLLWILWAVSILFLLLACAGVANLLLARGVRRRPEMVVRLVLGAGRRRLIRQLLTETLLLAVAGSALGFVLSFLGSHWLRLLLPITDGNAPFSPVGAALVAALALAATILCGLAPAFHATGGDLNASLKAGNSGLSVSAPRRRIFTPHEFLAGGQLVLAMVLLISTALLLRSMTAHLRVPLGFQPKDVAVIKTDLPSIPALIEAWHDFRQQARNPNFRTDDRYAARAHVIEPAERAQAEHSEQFYFEAGKRLAELPGVVSVGAINPPPFANTGSRIETIYDYDAFVLSKGLAADGYVRYANAGAFSVLGIRLLAGRTFSQDDLAEGVKQWEIRFSGTLNHDQRSLLVRQLNGTAIINQALARRFWPNEDPIGKHFHLNYARTVVGVVSDIRESGGSIDVQPTVYLPLEPRSGAFDFVVKVEPGVALTSFSAAADRTLTALAQDLPPPPITSLQALTTSSLTSLRLALALLSCFSMLGIIVAGLGVYATATLMAATRAKEMSIRLALGASAEQIRKLALWRSARLVLLALPIGTLASWALARSLSHWLFQVGAADPASYFASAGILLAIALAAGLWPALRAAASDPATALRYE
jgi:ABC-type lipoprotein release transport system permease subunit